MNNIKQLKRRCLGGNPKYKPARFKERREEFFDKGPDSLGPLSLKECDSILVHQASCQMANRHLNATPLTKQKKLRLSNQHHCLETRLQLLLMHSNSATF